MTMTHNPFDGYRYDNNLALRVTFLLWLIFFWSCHHVLLLALAAFSKDGEVFHMAKEYAYSWPLLISDLPGVIVLLVCLRRTPEAGAKLRWLWHQGTKFLVVGLAISTAAMFQSHQQEITDLENYYCWITVVNVAIIAYLLISRRAREIFADFPVPIPKKEDSKCLGKF